MGNVVFCGLNPHWRLNVWKAWEVVTFPFVWAVPSKCPELKHQIAKVSFLKRQHSCHFGSDSPGVNMLLLPCLQSTDCTGLLLRHAQLWFGSSFCFYFSSPCTLAKDFNLDVTWNPCDACKRPRHINASQILDWKMLWVRRALMAPEPGGLPTVA